MREALGGLPGSPRLRTADHGRLVHTQRKPCRLAAALSCVALSALLASCAVYRPDQRCVEPSSGDLVERDRIRVHLVDGTVIDDRFIRVDSDYLECESRRLPLDDIERVQVRRLSIPWTVVATAATACAALFGTIVISAVAS
jgi:hypothetical protein